ncbi:MAG: acyl-CoA desaturase [Saprospirales bacterium]|nr:acyl-CoA desaturase [Saprospirales bacterium]
MAIFIFIVTHWYLSLFSQTFFHHRYAAHKMFDMSKVWEKVFFVFSFIVQGTSYLSPYAYGILHRMHHAYTDTEMDPHSPTYDKNLFVMMWRTKVIFTDIYRGKTQVEERFKKGVPEWLAFEKFANSWGARIFWMLFYTTFYILFATQWWMFLFLPVHFVMGPLHGAIINWFAHRYGYVNFKMEDTSKNLLPVDFLMLGESYHNNHHKYSSRPNFGVRWFEIDPVYPIIRLFAKLRIIRM